MPTYELRRRGYNVTAKPTKEGDFLRQGNNYAKMFENPQFIRCRGNAVESIKDYMTKWGNGSRAEICIVWKDDPIAHLFLAENRNGNVHFLDPQTATEGVEHYFKQAKEGYTIIHRMDNLNFTELIKECCEEVRQ